MKTVIIGLGVIGKVHYEVLSSSEYNVVAICDVDEKVKAQVSGVKFYTDYKLMIEEVKPDVVHICTPHYLHKEMVLYCLERDINVVCEKPLCIKKDDIQEILTAEKKSKAKLGICFQNRFLERNAYVKEYLQDKKVVSAIATLAWNRGKEYYAQASWRGTKNEEGGGVLINQAIHTIDLLVYLLGMPDYVTASVSNLSLKGVIEVEDSAIVLCTGKVNFSVFATNANNVYLPVDVLIKTETETIRLLDDKMEINGKPVEFASKKALGKECYGSGHGTFIKEFYNAIKTGEKFLIDGQEGSKALKIVLSAYESNGNKIKI